MPFSPVGWDGTDRSIVHAWQLYQRPPAWLRTSTDMPDMYSTHRAGRAQVGQADQL